MIRFSDFQPNPLYESVAEGVKLFRDEKCDAIIAVGGGKSDEPMELKVGDKVMYGKYAGTEVSFEGQDYLIMRQSDVIAVIE